ncbi:MAG: hypothetical protein KatS3mg087_1771 [Patescibacteria group bacterium]|nr:MAG: hypothetical protein KatS3mg087_1771 [Patescibacteria group bacterium]
MKRLRTRLQTTASQISVLKNRVKDLAIEVGDALLPTLRALLDNIQPIVKDIASWVRENPKLVKQIAMVTAGISILAAVLIPLGLMLQSLGTIITILGGAISLLVSPIGLVIAGLVALGVAYKTNFLGFGDAVDSVASRIKAAMPSIVQFMTELVGLLSKGDFGGAAEMLKGKFTELAASILPALLEGLNNLVGFVGTHIIVPLATEALAYVSSGQLVENLKTLGSALLTALEFGIKLYADYYKFIWSKIIVPLSQQVAEYVSSGQLWENMKTLGSALLTALEFGVKLYAGYYKFIFNKIIVPLAQQVADFIGLGTLWDNLKQLGISMLTAITSGILEYVGYFTFVYDKIIAPFVEQLMAYISAGELWNALVYLGQGMLTAIATGIHAFAGFNTFIYDKLVAPLIGQLESAITEVSTVATKIGEAIMTAIGVGIRNLVSTLEGTIKGAINDIVPSEIRLRGSLLGQEIDAGTITLPKPFPGYKTGTPFTGFGGLSEIAGYVHKKEAVVPANGMRVYPSPSGLRLAGAQASSGTTIVINGDVNLPNVRNSTDFIRELKRTASRMANSPF